MLDRVLHSRRRRRAVEALSGHAWEGPIVFLCHANLCRSPLAAAAFARALPGAWASRVEARSAGFVGAGRPSPAQAIAAASKLGVDLSEHRSRLVSAELLSGAVMTVVMSLQQARWLLARFGPKTATPLILGDLDPQAIRTRTIRDPWNTDAAVFDETYARIDRCVRVLAQLVTMPKR